MPFVPLVIDCSIPYAADGTECVSLLMLPLGTSTLLEHLISHIRSDEVAIGHVLVMPTFSPPCDYETRLSEGTSSPIRVMLPESLPTAFQAYESTDHLLVLEPRLWPAIGYDAREIARWLGEYRGATHAVCAGTDADTREVVERDDTGCVRRVQRFYNMMQWPEVARAAIVYSVVPARASGERPFRTLAELRAILSQRGVLSRDCRLASRLMDLATEHGFLALHEHVLEHVVAEPMGSDFTEPSPGIRVGLRSKVHPYARLIAPVVIQQDVTIDEGVTIIGPALVGVGSRIKRDATVAQSVLAAHTVVDEGITIRHRVATGHCEASLTGAELPMVVVSTPSEAFNGGLYGNGRRSASPALPIRRRRVQFALKRMMDVTFSALGLMALSPLFLLTAILIKLDSPGPAFFVHRRERKGGKHFSCVKFRTMTAGAHQWQRDLYRWNELDGPQFKIKDDPRVTRIGRWLRATNIDELPQLFNVLLGHMSLVGPRPSPFRENQVCVPWRLARLSVRPGITGLWQICRAGHRSQGDFHEWIYYDIAYVRHFSFWLDIKILLATILTLGGRCRIPLAWLTRTSGREHIESLPVTAT